MLHAVFILKVSSSAWCEPCAIDLPRFFPTIGERLRAVFRQLVCLKLLCNDFRSIRGPSTHDFYKRTRFPFGHLRGSVCRATRVVFGGFSLIFSNFRKFTRFPRTWAVEVFRHAEAGFQTPDFAWNALLRPHTDKKGFPRPRTANAL